MVCVAVPEPAEASRPAFAIADAVLASLAEVDDALFARLVVARQAAGVAQGPDDAVVAPIA
jgi:hypothetical protein